MTDSHTGALRERTPGQLCFGFFALFCLFLILRNPDVAIEYITSGLRLCAVTVIPSLFPFLVLSELIVSGRHQVGFAPPGLGSACGAVPPAARRLLRHPARNVLRLSGGRTGGGQRL